MIGPPSAERLTCRPLSGAKFPTKTVPVAWKSALVTAPSNVLITAS